MIKQMLWHNAMNMTLTIVFLMQKDSDAVKETLNQLSELGWAKKWSSQPYVSRRMVSPPFWRSVGQISCIPITNANLLFI